MHNAQMNNVTAKHFILLCTFCIVHCAVAWSYPSVERRPTGLTEPPISIGLSSITATQLDATNQLLYVASGETLKILDLATFAVVAAANTPYNISSDTDLRGVLKGVALDASGKKLYATQEGGKLLTYDLSSITTKPGLVTLIANHDLGPIARDSGTGILYILDRTNTSILRYNPASNTTTAVSLSSTTTTLPTINEMLFVPNISGTTGALYLTSTAGKLFVLPSNSGAASAVQPAGAVLDNLRGMATTPDGQKLYIVNATQRQLQIVNTTTNTLQGTVPLAANSDIASIAIASVTNPTGTYGFVSGSAGLSIFNTDTSEVFDLGTTSTLAEPLSVSGNGALVASSDGYLFLTYGNIGIVTDNPIVTVSSVTYSNGGSTLGAGDSVTLSIQSDEVGTYTVRRGGNTAGSGTLLTDSLGATSGTIAAANTAQSVTFAYNDNRSAWTEGSNTIFVFVTDSAGNVGRRATTVAVDTPPPNVVISSAGFGNNKIYVNLERLDVADIAQYRVYVDTSAAAVLTNSTVSASTTQPAAGSTPTVTVTGLTNLTTYFIAAEAVDTTGNVSPARTTTLATGAAASASPEGTFGPAGVSNEAGCTLIRPVERHATWHLEGRAGLYFPTGRAMKSFFGTCCSVTGGLSGGWLFTRQLSLDAGSGIFYSSGTTRGTVSGLAAQDRFKLLLVPSTLEVTWRADFHDTQRWVPYVRTGYDAIYFHEDDAGVAIQGLKHGLHGGGGLLVRVNDLADGGAAQSQEAKNIFLMIDGRYQWVSNFGATGLDLSGELVTAGVEMQF